MKTILLSFLAFISVQLYALDSMGLVNKCIIPSYGSRNLGGIKDVVCTRIPQFIGLKQSDLKHDSLLKRIPYARFSYGLALIDTAILDKSDFQKLLTLLKPNARLGGVYDLLGSRAAYFGDWTTDVTYQNKKRDSFLAKNSIQWVSAYTLMNQHHFICGSTFLDQHVEAFSGSGLFTDYFPHFYFYYTGSLNRNMEQIEPAIDSIIIYKSLMSDGPSFNPTQIIITPDAVTSLYTLNIGPSYGENIRQIGQNRKFMLHDSFLKYAMPLWSNLPKKYLYDPLFQSVGSCCQIPMNMNSRCPCTVVTIYRRNQMSIQIKKDNLPDDLEDYFKWAMKLIDAIN